jgi:replication factor C small subunit
MGFEVPYLEKHRPKHLDDILAQDGIISSTKNMLVNINEFPHILCSGAPGIGKSTYVAALARAIYKEFGDDWEDIVMEINASEERKLETVREKILTYCRTATPRYDVSRKMVILEEFDSFLGASQNALRRPMEQYASNVIFVITCNYPRKIISPIRSRCVQFAFKKPKPEHIAEYITRVADKESIIVEKPALDLIANNAYGDFRPALLVMQSSVQEVAGKRVVLAQRVLEVHNFLTEESVENIMELVFAKKLKEASELTEQYLASGVSSELILSALYNVVRKKDLFLNEEKGPLMLREFVEAAKYVENTAIPEAIFDSLYVSIGQLG